MLVCSNPSHFNCQKVTAMNTAQDVMNRHGVLPTSAKPGRRKAAKAVTGPIWMLVQVGDVIRVEGDDDVEDGEHVVKEISGPITRGEDAAEIRVAARRGSTMLIYNKTVKAILSRDGKPFVVTQEMVDALFVGRPIWESVKAGDLVHLQGVIGLSDGVHKVLRTDHDLYRGEHSLGVYIEDHGYISNESVKAIVTDEPVVVPVPASVPEPARVEVAPESWTFDRVKAEIRPGMRIAVKGENSTSYSLVQNDGVYEVDHIDTSDSDLPVRVKVNDDTRWVRRAHIIRIVPASPVIMPVRGEFLIHVDVPSIMSNKANGEHKPVTVTRRLSDPTQAHLARELAWDGPTRFVHHEFMKLEGTDIQNWVETDVPVTCWRDTGLEVMTPKPDMVVNPMTKPILGAFVIHIAAPVLMKNRAEGRNDPVIAVRQAYTNWATDVHFARRVEWSGPTRMVHRPTTPVPGTNGRGVAFLETDAELTLFMDGREPMVLRMPQRQAAA
jgi:hypothetical protein